ncbi:MAG: hypothetical protein WCI89_01020 [bacterium]
MSKTRSPAAGTPLSWPIIERLSAIHILGLFGVWYLIAVAHSARTVAFALLWFFLCHLATTTGPHRLYAHGAYAATKMLEVFLLLFSAATFQGPAMWWAAMHQRHHAHSDTDRDPYSVVHGFWWAHVGWMLRVPQSPKELVRFRKNQLIQLQAKYYEWVAPTMAFLLPALIASLWGDFWGGLLVAGFLRLVVQFHLTWIINSWAHSFGTRRYGGTGSARTNWWLAIPTVGESLHERHHLAEQAAWFSTYWYDIDPGGFFIRCCVWVGLASNPKAVSEEEVYAKAR